jgi:hypothetical protein
MKHAVFPIQIYMGKKEDALWPLLFNYALEYAVMRVPAKQGGGVKLNGTHQLVVYCGGNNLLGKEKDSIKKNNKALLLAIKDVGLK